MPSHTAPAVTAGIVSQIGPVLRAQRDQGERDRRLAPEAVEAMVHAGVFQSLIPKAYGGLELGTVDALALFEEIARIDGSAGWIAANQSGLATIVAVFPEEAAAEVFAGGPALLAGALFPPGNAEPVAGGYRVTGQWPFVSGCDYADWLVGTATVVGRDEFATGPDGEPTRIAVLYRAGDGEIVDTWHTLGMRGTGSQDVRATDLFVPEQRTWVIDPVAEPRGIFSAPFYYLGFWPIGALGASVGLGIAGAALDDFLSHTSKTPAFVATSLADRSTVQDRVARARGKLDAARAYLHAAAAEADADARGRPVRPAVGLTLALAATFAMEASVEVVNLVHGMAGTSAIRNERRFQQYFRDIHTLSQHAQSSTSRYESIGKLLLGRETDWVFFAA
jgi:alkylation response protein AidB-like acyl-CoA dehydrogenase